MCSAVLSTLTKLISVKCCFSISISLVELRDTTLKPFCNQELIAYLCLGMSKGAIVVAIVIPLDCSFFVAEEVENSVLRSESSFTRKNPVFF